MATRLLAPLVSVRRLPAAARHAWNAVLAWPRAVASAWRRPWADVGIVPGTSRTRIVMPWQESHTEAPSYVAVDPSEQRLLAWGEQAREMEGRAPPPVVVLRPFHQGAVGHLEAAAQLLERVTKKAPTGIHLGGLRAIVAVPVDATPLERLGLREAALASGARVAHLVDESLAVALGAGLTLDAPQAFLLVRVGAGTTQIAGAGFGGLLLNRSHRLGGEAMDRAITAHLKRHHRLWIGHQAAESLKHEIGSAMPLHEVRSLEVGGRDLYTGVPRMARVTSEDVRVAIEPVLLQITDHVRQSLAALPNEALADVLRRGIGLCGGAAELRGLDRFIAGQVGLRVVCLRDPRSRVARGLQRMLEDKRLLRAALLQEGAMAPQAGAEQISLRRPRPLRLAVSAAALVVALALALLRPAALQQAAATASTVPLEDVLSLPIQRFLEGIRDSSAYAQALLGGAQVSRALQDRVPLLETQLLRARRESASIAVQNRELSRLLRLAPARRASSVAAHVTLRDPTGWLSTLVIDLGTQGGARPGMSVLVAEGLLGEIVWAGPGSSRVRLLTSPGSVVACKVEGRNAAGVLYGTGEGTCELRYLDPDAPLRVGDRVLTSGLDNVHPAGLPVGRVERMQSSRDSLYRTAVVRPSAPLDSTGTVLLVPRG